MQIQQAAEAGWMVDEFPDFRMAIRSMETTFYDGVVFVWGGSSDPMLHIKALTDVIKRQAVEKRTRLLVYTAEERLPKPMVEDVLRNGAIMVTASAVELAVALNGTYCDNCHRLLAEPSLPANERLPCPQCGSTARQFKRGLAATGNATSQGSATLGATSGLASGPED